MIGQLSKEEVNRKLLHILALVLPFGIFYIPIYSEISRVDMLYAILSLLSLSILIEFSRMRSGCFADWFSKSFGSMMRTEEQKQLTGATYVIAGSAICAVLSLNNERYAVASFLCLSLFILGDAIAAIVGKAFGRMKIGKKTIEGALACFFLCLILSGLLFPYLPFFFEGWGGNITTFQILIISGTVSALEFFPLKWRQFVLNDNLYVPGVTTLISLNI